MLGTVVLGGLGLLDLRALAEIGGQPDLAVADDRGRLPPRASGFIVSGYCPGTSLVAAASGKLDGPRHGGRRHRRHLRLLRAPAPPGGGRVSPERRPRPLLPVRVAAAPARGPGARRRADGGRDVPRRARSSSASSAARPTARAPAPPRAPRRFAFAAFGGVATARARHPRPAAPARAPPPAPPAAITAPALARRVLEAPWTVRVLDLRGREACAPRSASRAPSASPRPSCSPSSASRTTPACATWCSSPSGTLAALPPAAAGLPGPRPRARGRLRGLGRVRPRPSRRSRGPKRRAAERDELSASARPERGA